MDQVKLVREKMEKYLGGLLIKEKIIWLKYVYGDFVVFVLFC